MSIGSAVGATCTSASISPTNAEPSLSCPLGLDSWPTIRSWCVSRISAAAAIYRLLCPLARVRRSAAIPAVFRRSPRAFDFIGAAVGRCASSKYSCSSPSPGAAKSVFTIWPALVSVVRTSAIAFIARSRNTCSASSRPSGRASIRPRLSTSPHLPNVSSPERSHVFWML